MKQDVNNNRHYSADEGKVFVRTNDSFRLGREIYLATNDNIELYSEDVMNESEIKFYEDLEKERHQTREDIKKKHKE